MQRCAHCGHYGRRNAHCSSRKKKLRHKTPRPRQRADKNDKKRGILPTECFIPVGTPRYSHKSFDDKRCIRLLVLLPGNKWDPVRCELVVRPLDNAQYEAISYAWGRKKERGDILCHDQRLRVPWNLEHGLRKFRRLRKKRVLWADSVCINQDDMTERGHQVQNMWKVYENARKVLVWLGVHEYSNPSALFEFIRALGPLPPPDDQFADYVNFRIKEFGWKYWPTFNDLNHTAWFSRVWVTQEICLASSAIIHYGPASLDWETLASFCRYLDFRLPEVVTSRGILLVGPIVVLQDLDFRNSGQSIPFVLLSGTFKGCLDPRDRIYAFLGHKSCLDTISNPNSELFLPVHYSVSYKDLYTAVAVRILRAENFSSLTLIEFVDHDSINIYDREMCSWVPRWENGGIVPLVYIPKGPRYVVHGQAMVEASLNGNCLAVAGFTFDSVAWVSEIFSIGSRDFPSEPSYALHYRTPHPFVQAWNYIQTIGNTNSRRMLKAMCLTIARTAVRNRKERERRFFKGAVTYAFSMGLDVSGVEDLISFEDMQYFRRMVACLNRRYLITSRGWIGTGSRAVLPDDDVCIFFGAHTPFCVRQIPSASEALYLLCGPCRVTGIMQGEAIEMFDRGAFEKTTFNLI